MASGAFPGSDFLGVDFGKGTGNRAPAQPTQADRLRSLKMVNDDNDI